MLSSNEKSQVQALQRTAPILPLRPGLPEKATQDHIRHCTTTLFAALEVATGKVNRCLHAPPSYSTATAEGPTVLGNDQGDPVAVELLDETGRSACPPKQFYYVTWGRARLKASKLYRGPGWARDRVRRAESDANAVRVYEGRVTWVDVTDQYSDPDAAAKARELLGWAGTNRIRRALLDQRQWAEFVRRREGLDRAVDSVTSLVDRFLRRPSKAS